MKSVTIDPPTRRLLESRVEPHIADMRFHDYNLLWLCLVCYMQGMLDLMEVQNVKANSSAR